MINLKAEYGKVYRIRYDESAVIDGQTKEERLWLYQIPCKYGHIYVHGERALGAYSDRRVIGGRLARLDGVKLHQRGDREVSVIFPPELLPAVADLLKARKRVRLSDEQRSDRAERMARLRASSLPNKIEANSALDSTFEGVVVGLDV